MEVGAVQSGRTAPPDSNVQNEVAMEDNEILRRLVRLLSKSEEDELFAQDAHRQPSSSALHSHVFHRSKSEGDTGSVQLLNRSRSVIRLADTAPLRISRLPKVDLLESYKEFERNSSRLRTKLARLQNVLRGTEWESTIARTATRMSIHLENVTNYMKQQIEILAQAESGPPSEVHAQNLSSALLSLAHSARALARVLNNLREDGLLEDVEDLDGLENLAQLAESEARSLKDSKADDSLKRMSGIHFRQHSAELNSRFAKACEDIALCLSGVIKSVIPTMRQRRDREGHGHLLRTGVALVFSVVTAMMLSVSVERGSASLDLAISGVWLVSLAFGVASGITGIVGLSLSEVSSQKFSGKTSGWLAKGSEVLFLIAATLFSVGLCIFAFSSSQATAVRAIVTIFTSLHFLCLFVLFAWLLWSRNAKTGLARSDSHHRRHGGSIWSSMRNLAQLSIQPSVGGPADVRGHSMSMRSVKGVRDVESGLHRSPAFRRPTTPIIRVTDTDQENQEWAPSAPGSPMNANQMGSPSVHRNSNPVANPDADAVYEINSVEGSEHDLTSLSFSHSHTLAIPSAQRLSSDSSRSLPALPADVQIARCMAYSPNGMFLCIGNASPQERCTIFSADSPAITLGELKLTDIARQIEWSIDGENMLLRLTHMTYVWNAMPSTGTRRPVIIIHQDSDNMKWLINSDSFLLSNKDVLTSFHVDGTPTGVFQIPAPSIQDFVVTNDGHRVICLVSNLASTRSGTTATSTQKLIVYNMSNKAVEQISPVGRDALSIVKSTISPELILVNFVGTTPPQIWRYRENTDAAERRTSTTFLSFKRAMSFKAPSGRFSGYGIFGSADDKLILSLGEDGDMFIFASDTGQPLRHITTSASHSESKSLNGNDLGTRRGPPLEQCVAWDPDILTFTVCMGHADGSIWQWKIPFGTISQDSSTFALVSLRDEDSTLIRPADVDKPVKDEKGET